MEKKALRWPQIIYMATTNFDLSVSVLRRNDENCEFKNALLFILWGNQYETKPPGYFLNFLLKCYVILMEIIECVCVCMCMCVYWSNTQFTPYRGTKRSSTKIWFTECLLVTGNKRWNQVGLGWNSWSLCHVTHKSFNTGRQLLGHKRS